MTDRRPTMVSVVIPVLNVETTIAEQLDALAGQTYEGDWEVVVADNGCTDRTVEIVRGFEGRVRGLRVVDARDRRSASHARDVGTRASAGDFIAECDGDDVVAPGWIDGLVSAAVATGADIVGGRLDRERLNPGGTNGPAYSGLVTPLGFLPIAPGGNRGLWREVVDDVGFDPEFADGGTDIDFSWRAQLAGHTIAFAPDALVYARRRGTDRGTARRWFVYGMAEARLFGIYRDRGMPAASTMGAAREWASFVKRAPHFFDRRRRRLVERISLRVGRLVGSVRYRVWFP